MAEIRMSMSEYDSMKKEMSICKEIIGAMAIISIDSWSKTYYESHYPTYSLPLTSSDILQNISIEARDYLRKTIESGVSNSIVESGMAGTYQLDAIQVNVGKLVPIPTESKEEDTEEGN